MDYKSCAQWPVGCFDAIGNYSEDMHDSRDDAEHVCSLLSQRGAGGYGIFFPVKTWVEEVPEKKSYKPMTQSIDQRAREAAAEIGEQVHPSACLEGFESIVAKYLTAQHAEDVAAGEHKTLMLKLWLKNCDNNMARGEMCQMTQQVIDGIKPARLDELTQPTQP